MGDTIDVLVNNAGGTANLSDDASTAEAARYANETLSGNLVGTFLMAHALGSRLRRPGGRIVNLSSIAAFRGGGDIYSAAKAGVVGLTYSLAGSLGPQGVTVNAVSPGVVLGTEFFGDRMTEERRSRTVAQVPVGRPGRPEDIAEAVFYRLPFSTSTARCYMSTAAGSSAAERLLMHGRCASVVRHFNAGLRRRSVCGD